MERASVRPRYLESCCNPRIPRLCGRPAQQWWLMQKSERLVRGIAPGGIGAIHLLARKIGLIRDIDRDLHLLKRHLPYNERDHVLNIVYNILAGGSRLEHIEVRRNDEVFLDALGAERIPDPTTAGDFCRRFTEGDVQS